MVEEQEKSKEAIIAGSFQELITQLTKDHPKRAGERLTTEDYEIMKASEQQQKLIEAITQVRPEELAEIIISHPPKVYMNASNSPESVELKEIDPGSFTRIDASKLELKTAELTIGPIDKASLALSYANEHTAQLAEASVNTIRNFLPLPKIADNFGGSHRELRSPWENGIFYGTALIDKIRGTNNDEGYGFALMQKVKANKLKGSTQLKVYQSIQNLSLLTAGSQQVAELHEELDSMNNELGGLKNIQPAERVTEVANIARRALITLHRHTVKPTVNVAEST